MGDAATPYTDPLCGCHDLTGDGKPVIKLFFDSRSLAAVLELESFVRNDLVELTVSGAFLNGREFIASDCIRIVQ